MSDVTAQAFREAERGGAVDLDACPTRTPKLRFCRCVHCDVCGYPKHSAIHGQIYGEPPGSRPYGHVFVHEFAEKHDG